MLSNKSSISGSSILGVCEDEHGWLSVQVIVTQGWLFKHTVELEADWAKAFESKLSDTSNAKVAKNITAAKACFKYRMNYDYQLLYFWIRIVSPISQLLSICSTEIRVQKFQIMYLN